MIHAVAFTALLLLLLLAPQDPRVAQPAPQPAGPALAVRIMQLLVRWVVRGSSGAAVVKRCGDDGVEGVGRVYCCQQCGWVLGAVGRVVATPAGEKEREGEGGVARQGAAVVLLCECAYGHSAEHPLCRPRSAIACASGKCWCYRGLLEHPPPPLRVLAWCNAGLCVLHPSSLLPRW